MDKEHKKIKEKLGFTLVAGILTSIVTLSFSYFMFTGKIEDNGYTQSTVILLNLALIGLGCSYRKLEDQLTHSTSQANDTSK